MIKIKNIFIGFLVSFIGSIPLGYLNVVGYDVFKKFGLNETLFYLLGVISIEFFVIYFTLLFANQLIANKKLLKFIEGFSVVFMFVLAFIFYTSASSETTNPSVLERYVKYSPFVVGLILSSLNFIQVPFWTSWNLYLLNGNYIEISKSRKYFYVFGTVFGTFSGMLVLIFSLNYLTLEFEFFKLFLFQFIIPIVFVVLGIFQGFKFYKKYYK
ncbi:MAG TPA: hypothetical protein PKH91_03405 [Flavobacterium sp.]|nr:hypothetical protein [Flavobacterium sp.]